MGEEMKTFWPLCSILILAVAVALVPLPAHAQAHSTTCTGSNETTATSIACSAGIAVASGDVMACLCRAGTGGTDTITVSDTGCGFTWNASPDGKQTDISGDSVESFWVKATSSCTATPKCSFTATQAFNAISCDKLTGTSGTLDAHSTVDSSGSHSSLTSGSFTTASASEILWFGFSVGALTNTYTAGSSSACASGGGTCTIGANKGGTDNYAATEFKVVSATQTAATMSVSSNQSGDWQGQVLTFAAAGGASKLCTMSVLGAGPC